MPDPVRNAGFSAIGADRNPIVAYQNSNDIVFVTVCHDVDYDSVTETRISGDAQMPAITIGTDGKPVVSYYDSSTGTLNVLACGNTSCSPHIKPGR